MRRPFFIALCVALFSLWQPGAVLAVQPGEALSDPALEARARALSTELRCMVCQNQSIDVSDADLARDLRMLVRERLSAGDSDAEVLDYIVSRYGEFVLLKPQLNIRNALLWGTPLILLLVGGGVMLAAGRSRRKAEPKALSAEESAALHEILTRRQ
ncbi:cytochrome c-type biogenesis protein [Mesorhizobium sp. 10J20-29]